MLSSKVVTPVKTGVQCFCNPLKSLDSGFHRNDDSWAFLTFYEIFNTACFETLYPIPKHAVVEKRLLWIRSAE